MTKLHSTRRLIIEDVSLFVIMFSSSVVPRTLRSSLVRSLPAHGAPLTRNLCLSRRQAALNIFHHPPTGIAISKFSRSFRTFLSIHFRASLRLTVVLLEGSNSLLHSESNTTSSPSLPTSDSNGSPSQTLDPNKPMLQITMTCTASDCDRHRSTHRFSKHAYEHGIVIIQCPGCKNR
jgi:hypothetical protein